LVRVHQWILEEKQQRLLQLQQLLERFTNDLEVLELNLEDERRQASRTLDGALAFQTFIAPALERRTKLRQSIENLEAEVDIARDELGAALQELKKYELAQANQARQDAAHSKRREQIALDELGIGLYRRGRVAGGEG
jgi:flagellar export protein FliJ